MSIKLDKIEPNFKNYFFKMAWPGLEPSHFQILPLSLCHDTILSLVYNGNLQIKKKYNPPPIKQMSKFSQITTKFDTN